jgi:hypothetical protein
MNTSLQTRLSSFAFAAIMSLSMLLSIDALATAKVDLQMAQTTATQLEV